MTDIFARNKFLRFSVQVAEKQHFNFQLLLYVMLSHISLYILKKNVLSVHVEKPSNHRERMEKMCHHLRRSSTGVPSDDPFVPI